MAGAWAAGLTLLLASCSAGPAVPVPNSQVTSPVPAASAPANAVSTAQVGQSPAAGVPGQTNPEAARASDCATIGDGAAENAQKFGGILRAANPPTPPARGAPAYFLDVPPNVKSPATILLALHGLGGNGQDFAGPLVRLSRANGWLLVAPTIPYLDYDNVLEARADEAQLLPKLESIIDDVPRRSRVAVSRRILGLGFSRGAGLLQRFAMTHPDRLAGMALASSGGNTLPFSCAVRAGSTVAMELPFPLGIAGFSQSTAREFDAAAFRTIPIWMAVGGKDIGEATPWGGTLGANRLERNGAYAAALRKFGSTVEFKTFPELAHEITGGEIEEAVAALRSFLPKAP
ncbi:MAG: hypothetical protein JOZ39_06710 [Chloroflexi bacterium]|nr:hypothetical protein [Chloroflexota bacterium]